MPGRQAEGNFKTLGDTLAKMMHEALDDIMARTSKGPDTV